VHPAAAARRPGEGAVAHPRGRSLDPQDLPHLHPPRAQTGAVSYNGAGDSRTLTPDPTGCYDRANWPEEGDGADSQSEIPQFGGFFGGFIGTFAGAMAVWMALNAFDRVA